MIMTAENVVLKSTNGELSKWIVAYLTIVESLLTFGHVFSNTDDDLLKCSSLKPT